MSAFDGITTHTGTIGLSDGVAATIAELVTINNATSGTVTLNSQTIAANYSDTAANLAAAFSGITTHTGNLTISETSTATIPGFGTINAATAGTVTLSTETIAANYNDTAVNLAAAFSGITTHTGELAITD